jgi:hypothetical protein
MFCANVLFHNTRFDPRSSPPGNMALTTSTPLGTEKQGLFFTFIAYTKLKREKKFKSCSKIVQFFARLHYQAHKRC